MVSIQTEFSYTYFDKDEKEWKSREATKYLGLDKNLHPAGSKKPKFTTDNFAAAQLCMQEWGLANGEVSKETRRVVLL